MISIFKGMTEAWQVQFEGVDITDMNVYFFIKKSMTDADADALYSDSFLAGAHMDPENGLTASRNQSATSTAGMPSGIFWYEFRLFYSGNPIDNAIGRVEFKQSVIDKISE